MSSSKEIQSLRLVIVGAGCSGACVVRELCEQFTSDSEPATASTNGPFHLDITVVDKGGPLLAHHPGVTEEVFTTTQYNTTAGCETPASRLYSSSVTSKLRSTFWKGVAYGAQDDYHLLNVPSSFMSAVHGQEGDFRRWMEECRDNNSAADEEPKKGKEAEEEESTHSYPYPKIDAKWLDYKETGHVCRRVFGQYLTHRTDTGIIAAFERLEDAKKNKTPLTGGCVGMTLRLVHGTAKQVIPFPPDASVPGAGRIEVSQGGSSPSGDAAGGAENSYTFDGLVLAHGNLPPKLMRALEPLSCGSAGSGSAEESDENGCHQRFIANPWSFPVLRDLSRQTTAAVGPKEGTEEERDDSGVHVAIVGTRLTAIDFALHLVKKCKIFHEENASRARNRITFISREGLFPFSNPGEEQLPSVDSTPLLVPEVVPLLKQELEARKRINNNNSAPGNDTTRICLSSLVISPLNEASSPEFSVELRKHLTMIPFDILAKRLTYICEHPEASSLPRELLGSSATTTTPSTMPEHSSGECEEVAAGVRWEQRLDSLRPWTSLLWGTRTTEERHLFLSTLRGQFEVRRHRVAPDIYRFMVEVLGLHLPTNGGASPTTTSSNKSSKTDMGEFGEGQVTSIKAAVVGSRYQMVDKHSSVTKKVVLQLQHTKARAHAKKESDGADNAHQGPPPPFEQSFDYVVNCTGPDSDYRTTSDPFIRSLISQGLIVPDDNGVALNLMKEEEGEEEEQEMVCDDQPGTGTRRSVMRGATTSSRSSSCAVLPGRVDQARQKADSTKTTTTRVRSMPIYAVGPPRRGSEWETIAVKEIRQQAFLVARDIFESTVK